MKLELKQVLPVIPSSLPPSLLSSLPSPFPSFLRSFLSFSLIYFLIFKEWLQYLCWHKPLCVCVCVCVCVCESLQLYPTLCDPMDCSPPGSSVHGILQVRILGWVPTSYSRGSSWPRGQTHISCLLHWQEGSLPLAPSGKHRPVLGI